jgi:ATP-dependent helicase Lhr and Lhr-like helicase
LYDVFAEYDPGNLLLVQAKREVLERQLESTRLEETLLRLQEASIQLRRVERPTPMAFPLLVDRLREKLSSEKLADRVQRMQIPLEKEANKRKRQWRRLKAKTLAACCRQCHPTPVPPD